MSYVINHVTSLKLETCKLQLDLAATQPIIVQRAVREYHMSLGGTPFPANVERDQSLSFFKVLEYIKVSELYNMLSLLSHN